MRVTQDNSFLGIPRFNGKKKSHTSLLLAERKFIPTIKDKDAFLKVIDFQKFWSILRFDKSLSQLKLQ